LKNLQKGGCKLKILITGLGITGKSIFHKWQTDNLKNFSNQVIALNFDYDRDKIPDIFNPCSIYIIEDCNGPCENAVLPLSRYNLVYYMLPSWFTHLKFYLTRLRIWFENGNFNWDADQGPKGSWSGTGKPYDWRNIPGILKYFWKYFPKRRRAIKKDLEVLKASNLPVYLVIPSGKLEELTYTFKFLYKK